MPVLGSMEQVAAFSAGDGLAPQPRHPHEVAGPSNYQKIAKVC